jgi:predicted Zn finger-like uncharacterized protein
MPEIVQCPECQRKLKVPDNLLGKKVKCPTCGATFTAASEAAPEPAPAPAPARRPRREEAYEEEPAPPAREREDYEEDEGDLEDRPRRRRRRRRPIGDYEAPHRGGTILTLGILSIVVGLCCPLAGIGLGIGALTMANADLPKMDRGEMDPGGMGSTRGGQICGIIGLILSILNAVAGVILMVAQQH